MRNLIFLLLFTWVVPIKAQTLCVTLDRCDQFVPSLTENGNHLPESEGPTLDIPALDIHVEITTFHLGEQSWVISPWERRVGHFEHTAWIEVGGNVVLGGHSRYPSGAPGIFYDLDALQLGDVIVVRDANLERFYEVLEVKTVDYQDLSVLYPTTISRLTLITCSIPSYVVATGDYDERVVVIAEEVLQD